MIIDKFSKTGAYHVREGGENQDYICSEETDDFLAIMLADGVTECAKGAEGAKLACEAAAQVVRAEGSVFFNYPNGKIAYLLKEQILYWIECNKAEECDVSDYASTFAMVFMDKRSGRCAAVNLGDGAVITIDEDGWSYLLRPKRYGGNPCLTTTKGAGKAIEAAVYNLALGDCIFICSDGFIEQMANGKIVSLLNSYDIKALNGQLMMLDNADDCSYISFKRKRK